LYRNDDDKHAARLAAKRYQRYMRGEEKKHSEWVQHIITTILMLIKLITNALEKANIKKKRMIEKISVE
jgi:hypothetical protein